jgi:hypothetical protein
MPRKPPPKKAWQICNTSGLRNQQRGLSFASESLRHPTPARSLAPSSGGAGDESDLEEDDHDDLPPWLDLLIHFDLLKVNLAYEEEYPDYMEQDEHGELVEWEGFGREIWQWSWVSFSTKISLWVKSYRNGESFTTIVNTVSPP